MFFPKVIYDDKELPQMKSDPVPFYLGGSQVPSTIGFNKVSQMNGGQIKNGVCHTGKRYLKTNEIKPKYK